jgi:hypothetical protein
MSSEYWNRRKHLSYYRLVVDLARKYAPDAKSVLDVGGNGCEYVNWLDWVPERVAIDLEPFSVPGVQSVCGDFMRHEFGQHFDLVLCLQVLEHQADPADFSQRLLETGDLVIVSVPFKWPPGDPTHLQDPIDEDKLRSWTGPWVDSVFANDAARRLITVYRGRTHDDAGRANASRPSDAGLSGQPSVQSGDHPDTQDHTDPRPQPPEALPHGHRDVS